MSNIRVIAFYLPQYHPTHDNDLWWGKGFTEWTNVGRARPLFKGHYQPKVPADLGYYDLRLPQVRKAQADLAVEAGIEGFCYYHYWFGRGKQELELPFNEVVKTHEPDFPFCLCWANESWHSKFWDKQGSAYSKKVLIEQRYYGHEDNVAHFYSLLPAFRDKRYIRVNGKILFMIYKPLDFDNIDGFINDWRTLAKENGLNDFYFVGQIAPKTKVNISIEIDQVLSYGLDAVNIVRLWNALYDLPKVKKVINLINRKILRMPNVCSYKMIYPYLIGSEEKADNVYPTIIPNWDHTPRSGVNGYVLTGSTPELFGNHIKQVLDCVNKKNDDNKIVFLKSWNEWGEGNYMEPDLLYGKQYINTLATLTSMYK